MQLKHKLKIYPPRVKMTVMMANSNPYSLKVKVSGCSSENQLDMDIGFPLGNIIMEAWLFCYSIFSYTEATHSPLPNGTHLQCQSHKIVVKG